jgi:small subunit ribosomal protein S8
MIDPISDMLTRIRNSQNAGHLTMVMPASKMKLAIARLLEENNFVSDVEKNTADNKDFIKIGLLYEKDGSRTVPVIQGIKRVSHEGQRLYIKKEEIKKVKNGLGISVISTSKGIMTGAKARQLGLGGEFICEVW